MKKLSAIIMDMVEPIVKVHGNSYERKHALIEIACFAWNYTLAPEGERDQSLTEFLNLVPEEEMKETAMELITLFTGYKRMNHPTDQRMIASFQLDEKGTELTIASFNLNRLEKSASDKPKRNDPCPCGSGKKHKKCCL